MNAKLITLEPKITNEGYEYNSIEFSIPHDIDMRKVYDKKDEIEKRFNYVLESVIREYDVEDVYLITIMNEGVAKTFQFSYKKEASPIDMISHIKNLVKEQYYYDSFAIINLTKLT